ncbi:MAG TPA: superoxide dismutase [Candidatus Binataceae bacterium]|jgi:Fe-Mn family superoxide dismutase|nr:superoxide dismutase [Candidatus Binataceae bacterium]
MAFELPKLPYAKNALAPYISEETLEYHHGKHHAAYVAKLNELVANGKFASMQLEEIVRTADGAIFNNAAQHWNHSFYWKCMAPKAGGAPSGELAAAIKRDFKSFEEFKKAFDAAAEGQFGSGWAWLVQKTSGSLAIEKTPNAENPLTRGLRPLLTCDFWEHAYYIDYRNARPKYVEAFWNVVNWQFVASNVK